MNTDETIAAIASSHDVGGHRGIVRVSGEDTLACVRAFFSATEPIDWSALSAAQRIEGSIDLTSPFGVIPCDLHLWPTNRSYTQQPTAELHTYGALPLLNKLVELVCQHGARLAEPGEFTLRSFLSGRIDLAQAEAVLGVIDAANDREMNVALSQLAGGLSQPLTRLRDTLLNLVADLEAGLDFVDEHIEFVSQDAVIRELSAAQETVEATLRQMQSRHSSGQLPRVVLRGEPNAGKSSLWNAMVGKSSAIVDATAGTTRDYLVGTVESENGRFSLIDTAGVEQARDALRKSMLDQGDSQAEAANLVVLCIDASRELTPWETQQLAITTDETLVVLTKSDLKQTDRAKIAADVVVHHQDDLAIRELIRVCSEKVQALSKESSVVGNTATRCRESLRLVGESVARASEQVKLNVGDELIASELRVALDHLGQIVGVIYTDDVLDRVFSRFCIGK